MKAAKLQRGQALILIVFGMVGMIALTGVAVDGGMAYSNRRTAQNAADNSALAAALAFARSGDPSAAASSAANTNGFDNNGTTNAVSVSTADATDCPHGAPGKVITVQITSHLSTYFAPVLGIRQLTNTVQAVSESCASYVAPLFDGDAIVALSQTDKGFNATGGLSWDITGGGIFTNSSSNPSSYCNGSTVLKSPGARSVGQTVFSCNQTVGTITEGVKQQAYNDYVDLLPRIPACDGTAMKIGSYWVAQPGKDGSRVAIDGSMNFGPGLFCITNSPGTYHGDITGTGVTFYIMPDQFTFKLNGGGGASFAATAPTSGEYANVLIFSGAQLCETGLLRNQTIDLRGNGSSDITGSIIVPSATVTMYGNSNSRGIHSQIVAYSVDTGGGSVNNLTYNSGENYMATYPAWLTLLK